VTAMSIVGRGMEVSLSFKEVREWSRSCANIAIRESRSEKDAAEGALSALCVLKRRRKRIGGGWSVFGVVVEVVLLWRADLARMRWAFDGGLNEESRISRVFEFGGGVLGNGLIVWRTLNRDSDDWKDRRPLLKVGRMERSVWRGIDMSADCVVMARA